MSRKYDPPNKAALRAQNPRIESIVELAVAAAEAQFPPKVKTEGEASRARVTEHSKPPPRAQARAVDHPNLKRGRKRVVTPERVQMICDLLAKGETERSACIRANISSTAWNAAKRADATLRQRIAVARDDWAQLRHAQHAAALFESQSARAAGRKALKPQPTRQAKWMVWHLTFRVPLNFAAIPEEEIASACERCGLSAETWRRQDRAFGLMKKVYAKRAQIRGEQAPAPPVMEWSPPLADTDSFFESLGYSAGL